MAKKRQLVVKTIIPHTQAPNTMSASSEPHSGCFLNMGMVIYQPRTFNCIFVLLVFPLAQWAERPLKTSSLCLSKPCQNGAECQDNPSTLFCQCQVAALSSVECTSSNILCQPPICQGNATCQSTGARPGQLACSCGPGLTGQACHSSAKLCAQRLCHKRARCLAIGQKGPGYICLCQPGYAGSQCQKEVDQCTPNPCHNNAICRSMSNGPTCFCVPGFQGELCDIKVNECASQPCKNGATCIDNIGYYECLCKVGYTGASCEVEINECLSQPCLHGGSCHDLINGFSCTCASGFQGHHCETDVDDCRSHPCENGGLCIDGLDSYSCDCSHSGFSGLHCELPPPCWSQPCLNGATCINKANYNCKGVSKEDTDDCASLPCQNGGSCQDALTRYRCCCTPGYTGPQCQMNTAYTFKSAGNHLSFQTTLMNAEAVGNIILSFRTMLKNSLLFQRRTERSKLTLELLEGRLSLCFRKDARMDGASWALELPQDVANGDWHTVEVMLDDDRLRLCLFDPCQRKKCCAESEVEIGTLGLRSSVQSFVFGGNEAANFSSFIGCMRDISVDSKPFIPEVGLNTSVVNVTLGCNHCLEKPCKNQGTCVNQKQGHQCEHQWQYKGYNCTEGLSIVTFQNNLVLKYHSNGLISCNLTSISFSICTNKRNAYVLHANSSSDFVTISLQDGLLVLELLGISSSPFSASPLVLRSTKSIANGEWYYVKLFMVYPKANVSKWNMLLLPEDFVTSETESGNLNFLREGVDILLGGHNSESSDWSLTGCLTSVEIGGIILPYYDATDVKLPQNQEGQFIKTSTASVQSGCMDMLCQLRECPYSSRCEEICKISTEQEVGGCAQHLCTSGCICLPSTGKYTCVCTDNVTGSYCIDFMLTVSVCGNDKCNYTCFNGGNCSETRMECDCLPVFIEKWSAQDLEEYVSNLFLNGNFCCKMVNKFHCVCELRYTCDTCQIYLNEDNLTTKLLVCVSLASVVLFFSLMTGALMVVLKRRSTCGAYSPSRQEHEGSRVEMCSMLEPPHTERLI